MDNALKKNSSLLLAGNYGKSAKSSTRRRHHSNMGKSGLVAEMI
jgi:hypothetical protein